MYKAMKDVFEKQNLPTPSLGLFWLLELRNGFQSVVMACDF